MILEDQADRIPEAWEMAEQIRSEDDRTFDGRKKRVPKQINAGHVRKAVTNLLGPAKGKLIGNDGQAKAVTAAAAPDHLGAFLLGLLRDAVSAIEGQGVPEWLRGKVEDAYEAARQFEKGSAGDFDRT